MGGSQKATLSQQAPSTTEAANSIVDIPFTSRQELVGLADMKEEPNSVCQQSLPPKNQDTIGEKDGEKDGEKPGETKCEKDDEKDQNSPALVEAPIIITKKIDSKSNPKPATVKIVWRPPHLAASSNQEMPETDINSRTSFSANLNKRKNKTVAVKTNASASHSFTCGTCKRKFDTIHLLEKHKLQVHGTVDKYKCRLCSITYRNRRSLSIHVKRDHPGSQKAPHQCAMCELAFPDKDLLAKHAKEHELTYSCEFCHRVFKDRTKFNKHTEEIHVKNEDGTVMNRGFECGSCKQVFKTLRALSNHIKAFCKNNMTEDRPFSCRKCDETFWNSLLLRKHSRKVHKEQVDPNKIVASHKCQLCSKTFISPAALKLHACRRPCRQFKCQLCDKLYKSQASLVEHMEMVHSDKKPEYTCEQCGKVYARQRSLKYHLQEHVNGKKMYKCAFCPKQYTSKQSVGEHERKHRGEQVLCPWCGKNFASMKIFRTHERFIHKNKKKYVCTICSKAYHDSYKLKCHIDSHTGSRNVKCRYCDKRFTYSGSRALHQKTQHPEEHGEYMRKLRERNRVEIIQPGEVGCEIQEAEEGDLEIGKIDDAAEISEDSKESGMTQNHSDNVTKDMSINEMEETKSENEIDKKFEDTEMSEETNSSKDGFFQRISLGNQNPWGSNLGYLGFAQE